MKRETRRYGIAFAVLLVLLGGLLIWNLNAGSFPMTASQVLAILFGQGGDETASRIVWDIRLPRILGAALLGGALSISGFLLQTFFANPIASPFVLGISSGAKLTVALTMIFLLQRGILSNSFVLIGSAFVGAMMSMGFVLLVSQKIRRMSVLVICGIMVGYICSAVTDFAVTFAEDANIVNLHNWSVGSFSGITWSNLGVIAGTVGLLSVQANGRVSAGGELCPECGGFHPPVSRGADPFVQCSVRLCHGFCRPHLLCGHRGAPLGSNTDGDLETHFGDSRVLSGRCGVLPVLRLGRQNGFCAGGDEHQFCDRPVWRAHCHLYDGPPAEQSHVSGERQMNAYYLQTEQMTVGYHGKPLIEKINLCLRRGEIMTLIGPNGSGKSTILKSIVRQLRPLGGVVRLEQVSLEELSPQAVAQKMSVLMTDRLQPELMTCREVAAAGRYPYTGKLGLLTQRDWEKVDEALALVHGSALADQAFTAISDGQRQRVLLARALCQEPEILVLDEPTSFLDIRYKLEILSTLKELVRQRQLAVVLSLHELDLAQRVSDLVVCVHNNAIERCGPPEAVFTSDYITTLYELTQGSYEPGYGSLELPRVQGAVKAFVIGGNGEGIGTYRRLQREGVPFVAGVLHENDVEFPAARALAVEVIAQKAFEPIGAAQYQQAMAWLERCERVFCCCETFGTMNEPNRWLKQAARERGKLVDWTEVPHGL